MTAKTQRKERVIDCTRGVTREQRAINRSIKRLPHTSRSSSNELINEVRENTARRAALAEYRKQQTAEEEKRYGGLPDRVVTGSSFVEKPFGEPVITSANDTQVLSRIVVSLALFDGDKMLFACSGIPLPDNRKPTKLDQTRFVTSARLAIEFNANRYRDDNLRVEVRLPHNETVAGLLGLYDKDIAIVTCLCHLDVNPVNLDVGVDLDLSAEYVCDDDRILAVGCAFESGSLMATKGSLLIQHPDTWVSDTQNLSEAVLGGPIIGKRARFLGMNHEHIGDANMTFLSREFLRKRLKHFRILNHKKLDFRGYSLPKGVSRIVPSGFWNTINRVKARGYPIPPPLVLELNGKLLNKFEEFFGDIIEWKGNPFLRPPKGSEYGVWARLPKKVVTNVSYSVVSVTSFDGDERFFACSGLLIRWHRNRTVVLTSACLVRSRSHQDFIENSLRIEVFLPPNHDNRVSGTLEWYDLHYNIAVVSLANNLGAVRPSDIVSKVQESSGEVIAVGRDADRGFLMASFGEVMYKKDTKLFCKDLKLCTCKIKKAGIGGPLISLDGSFVGMNFYDGRKETPFLPQSKIRDVLLTVIDLPLSSERGCGLAITEQVFTVKTKRKKWPVPEPYWYHGTLELDRYHIPNLPGRRLQ